MGWVATQLLARSVTTGAISSDATTVNATPEPQATAAAPADDTVLAAGRPTGV
jgi:hypothetical protein